MNPGFEEGLCLAPFSLRKRDKETFLLKRVRELSQHHQRHCSPYQQILTASGCDLQAVDNLASLPFLPVSLFKKLTLRSVPETSVVKTMTSSGTSGQQVSRIFLDKSTAGLQQKVLVKIVSDFIGTSRLPLLVIDSSAVMKDRAMFSARGAGILGFSLFGQNITYALDENMALNHQAIAAFLARHQGKPTLLFGFTFMIWQHFCQELKGESEVYDFSQAMMIHGGGWKKLQSQAVSPHEFAGTLKSVCGIPSVTDYYGMVEQTGCIYLECEQGHLHVSIYSDVIIRNPQDFSVCVVGEVGIIQVISALAESYPGHSLLTEDEGVLIGEDDCPCGRHGKYFRVIGRLKDAELRGCSDTYAAQI